MLWPVWWPKLEGILMVSCIWGEEEEVEGGEPAGPTPLWFPHSYSHV